MIVNWFVLQTMLKCSLHGCGSLSYAFPHPSQILGKAGSTVETRFGTASVLRYPARVCLSERTVDKGSALRDAKRTVEVSGPQSD